MSPVEILPAFGECLRLFRSVEALPSGYDD
jgi:hypothetical protein